MLRLHTRAIDPLSGDRPFDDTRRTWAEPASPELALVQNVLRTPLGSAGRDRTYGVEPIENAAPNVAARWRQNVLRALSRWILRGVLREVVVTSETRSFAEGPALFYTVSFRGRDGRPHSTAQTRALP